MESVGCWKLQLTASSAKNGQAVQRYFSDVAYGSAEHALAAAQRARDGLKDIQRKSRHRKGTLHSASRNLPTGVTYAIERRSYSDGRPRFDIIWRALWMVPGEGEEMHQSHKRFSSRHHGYANAFLKARRLRAEKSGFDLSAYTCPDIGELLEDEDDAFEILKQLRNSAGA